MAERIVMKGGDNHYYSIEKKEFKDLVFIMSALVRDKTRETFGEEFERQVWSMIDTNEGNAKDIFMTCVMNLCFETIPQMESAIRVD